MPFVTCNMSLVKYQVLNITKIYISRLFGGARWVWVCYQRGLPCLVVGRIDNVSHKYCYTPPISDIGHIMVYLGCIDFTGWSLLTYLTTLFVELPTAKSVGLLITIDKNKPLPSPIGIYISFQYTGEVNCALLRWRVECKARVQW